MYLDVQHALEIWDILIDEAEIFVFVNLGDNSLSKSMFLEKRKNSELMLLPVFLNKEEALLYKEKRNLTKASLAKTTVGYLMQVLYKHWALDKVDRQVDCVLSTCGADGDFYPIEILWSNIKKPS